MNTLLIKSFLGWRNTWILWIALIAGIFYPIAVYFYKDKPQDVGLDYTDPPTELEMTEV